MVSKRVKDECVQYLQAMKEVSVFVVVRVRYR